jgi:hypothetical protein
MSVMVMSWIAALQPVPVAAVLAWTGWLKVSSPAARRAARSSALATIVGKERAPFAHGALGAVELAVAAGLAATGALAATGVLGADRAAGPGGVGTGGGPAAAVLAVAAGAATALTLGFLGYLVYARLFAPDASCGCVSAKQAPIRWRQFARAGLLLVASAVALVAGPAGGGTWPVALGAHPVAGVGLVVLEVLVVLGLSPELDRRWLMPLRKLWYRLRPNPLAGAAHDLPLESTVTQLRNSDAYRRVAAALRSDVLDSWDEGDWRLVSYAARTGSGAGGTAVFAVPRLRYAPDAVRVALVADDAPSPEPEFAPA